ncbi:hypothetical protein SOVF_034790 [Spinacia oleracea]|nr:hypothetical protein SOVF_034790 [Spinacia oleracea]
MVEQLNDAHNKNIMTSLGTRKLELLKMVGGDEDEHECGGRGAYCKNDEDCCPGRTCREDDDQDYYTGFTTCV